MKSTEIIKTKNQSEMLKCELTYVISYSNYSN